MSLNTVSVKINNNTPSVNNIRYDKSINVSVNDQQNYKVKNVNIAGENALSVKINNKPLAVDSLVYDKSINVKVGDQQDYKVRNIGIVQSNAVKRLRDLLDVSATSPQHSQTLIFNAATQKFETDFIKVEDISFDNIDAGTF